MRKVRVALIGAGKVGSTLAIVLNGVGYEIAGVLSLHKESAEWLAQKLHCAASNKIEDFIGLSDIILIATPDREIANVAKLLVAAKAVGEKQIVLHTCGAQSAELLACVRTTGAKIGSIHPLQSFSSVDSAVSKIAGIYFAVDGDRAAVCMAKKLVAAIGGKSMDVSEKNRALYHAAACMASNYLVTIVYAATQMFEKLGITEEDAITALMPILNGTLENIQREGTLQALTGPIVRGDVETVRAHLTQIDQMSKSEAEIYRDLGRYTAAIAELRGALLSEQKEELTKVLGHNN